ncbi:hypothetical protein [Sphingorhabdus sp. 109]|jgi:hypothetical protein|uniref:hypothetical protein n=1 Tax=Sphingorhabdus sp. 109 TaxID=2653173 RepID=UPI0012F2DF9B|nr:hypothetical protein [Sphingorhabdus sp. 109]VWX57495.1 conserved hypothetical protein [Sphingorhabdus sp. 109]
MANKLLTKAMDRENSRHLVVAAERPGHSFRRSLPVKIVDIAAEEHDSDRVSIAKSKGFGEDVSLFLLSFLAFFTAFYMFIV